MVNVCQKPHRGDRFIFSEQLWLGDKAAAHGVRHWLADEFGTPTVPKSVLSLLAKGATAAKNWLRHFYTLNKTK